MNQGSDLPLSAECSIFCVYLVGQPARRYVEEKYADAHTKSGAFQSESRFDDLLVSFAAAGPAWTRVADSYARVLAPRSALRKKLVLLLAILECSSPEHERLDIADEAGLAMHLARFAGHALVFLGSVLLGATVLLPAQIALGLAQAVSAGSQR